MVALAIAAFVAIAFLKLPFPVIIIGAALCGAVLHFAKKGGGGQQRRSRSIAAPAPEWTRPNARRAASSPSRCGRRSGCCRSPRCISLLGGAHVFSAEALFFSKMAAVTFGGAYAVLPMSRSKRSKSITGCSPTRC